MKSIFALNTLQDLLNRLRKPSYMKWFTFTICKLGFRTQAGGGTYHNKKYKEAAEKHGLTVEKDAKYGWTKTSLNDEAKAFVDGMQDKKFELHRKSLPKIPGAAKTKQSSRKYVCPACGCIIRATKEVHVICGDCNVEFEEEA